LNDFESTIVENLVHLIYIIRRCESFDAKQSGIGVYSCAFQSWADPEVGFGGRLQCLFLGTEGTKPRRQKHREREAEGVDGVENEKG